MSRRTRREWQSTADIRGDLNRATARTTQLEDLFERLNLMHRPNAAGIPAPTVHTEPERFCRECGMPWPCNTAAQLDELKEPA